MLNTTFTALSKAECFVATSLQKISGISAPVRKFFTWLMARWWMLPVRYNVLNLSRYGGYSQKAIHQQLKRKLPFVAFFHTLFEPLVKKECIAAFDPCFIRKSGSKTYGVGRFWNGTLHQAMKGLEMSCLALIDVKDRTAYAFQAEQTPAKPQNFLKHYSGIVTKYLHDITRYTRYLAVDGYFWKKGFVTDLLDGGLEVICKGRRDCKLFYLHEGPQPKRGRPRKYDGPVQWPHLDGRRWKPCYEDQQLRACELVVYSPMLHREIKAVYVEQKQSGDYAVLLSTDKQLAGQKVMDYYHLRFQIEFLIRDAKSYTGLEQGQSRSQTKLYNHFNMALYSVSAAKFLLWAQPNEQQKPPFSMRSVKTCFTNKFLAELIFAKLDLDLNHQKIKTLMEQCLNIGKMAA